MMWIETALLNGVVTFKDNLAKGPPGSPPASGLRGKSTLTDGPPEDGLGAGGLHL